MNIVHSHTPGPWRVGKSDLFHSGPTIMCAEGMVAAVSYGSAPHGDGKETAANALLIAASPRLLDATKHLVREIEFLIEEGSLPQSAADHPSMILARQAIASADGSAA